MMLLGWASWIGEDWIRDEARNGDRGRAHGVPDLVVDNAAVERAPFGRVSWPVEVEHVPELPPIQSARFRLAVAGLTRSRSLTPGCMPAAISSPVNLESSNPQNAATPSPRRGSSASSSRNSEPR